MPANGRGDLIRRLKVKITQEATCEMERKVCRKICALYAESRKLIRYDGSVNFVTFLTYLHAGLYLLPISQIITYYYVLFFLCAIPTNKHPTRVTS